jgi:hypothetical protein
VQTTDNKQHETLNQAFVSSNAASEQYSWRPPDLSATSDWTKARVSHLISSALLFQDPGPLIEEGLRILRRHRTNYTSEGPNPTHLQLLWWEFPEESWDDIRNGCSMNFILRPPQETTPNSAMAGEQIAIAEEFIKELVSLGVLIRVQPGEMVANGPLFCLPKPGQPGQWRVLSDMKRGGQNKCIGADPTVFPKTGVILDQLYAGGYSAVVDASKFFYNFPTRKDERKYLGCIGPTDPNEQYVYAGLPMGAGNSPSIAGRHGAAVLRLVRSLHDELFSGNPVLNTWWSHFGFELQYDPKLGHGLNFIGTDGLPAVLIWAHCDDFFIHGPTYAKAALALTAFLDLTVQLGLLCHPGKLTPPAQVVKYTDLLFDTQDVPTLRIPEYKRAKALALVN